MEDINFRGGNPDFIALDGRLGLEFFFLDEPDDFARLLDGDADLEMNFLFDGSIGSIGDLLIIQGFQSDLAPDELLLERLFEVPELDVVLGDQG